MPAVRTPDKARVIEKIIPQIRDEHSFIQKLLIDTLDWPVDESAITVDDITYEWSAEELRVKGLDKRLVDGVIRQIVLPGNPWGIFILEFKNPDVFTTGRGMTGTLRSALRGLVPSKRKSARLASFKRENLLFICNHKYQHFRFAHFKPPASDSPTPPLTAFGWGPGDPIRTLCEFNLCALTWPDVIPTDERDWINHWAQAFNVEKVTAEFYKNYSEVFEHVENIIKNNATLRGDDLRLFTQSLFNRLMFLRFIESKGWLKFPDQGGTNYLSALHSAGGIGKRSLYQSRIKPLFFEGLAIEGRQQSQAFGSVPFLNGGLFEQSELDQKVADIPDEAFQPIIQPQSPAVDGGLFYRYNFTVEESTPLDIEVAVDPEMLGKVFEELVTGRHESGSYYTPRPVVSFMCREALKGYLEDKLCQPSPSACGTGQRQGALKEAIDALVDRHIVKGLTDAHAKLIIDALESVKAVDPACGSGAYLLGLLHELIAIRRALQAKELVSDPQFLYNLKLHIISNNLYGVDIDPFATEIAKLRLWLSLAVDADQPVPLPNLDFKFETGDSLIGPDPSAMPDLFREQLQRRADLLVTLKDKYLRTYDATKYDHLEVIHEEERDIAKALHSTVGEGVIDWRIHFADVFGTSGGFDILLANPPYIDSETMTKHFSEVRELIKASYSMTKGNWDIYIAFFERGFTLLNDNGVLCFITPDKWLSKPFGEEMRARTVTRISCILNIGRSVFQSSNVDAIVSIFTEKPQSNLRVLESAGTEMKLKRIVDKRDLKLPFAYDWLFSDFIDLLGKIEALPEKLSNYGLCENACATSDAYKLKELLQEVPAAERSSEFMRIINTGTIGKYASKWGQREMVYLGDRYLRPVVNRTRFCRTFPNSYGRKAIKPKLIVKGLNLLDACLDADGSVIPGKSTLVITAPDLETLKLLLAIANSRVAFFYLKHKYPASSYNQGTTFTKEMVSELPFPPIPAREKAELLVLVDRILEAKSADPSANTRESERDLDALVHQLYGLSKEDLEVMALATNAVPQGNRP